MSVNHKNICFLEYLEHQSLLKNVVLSPIFINYGLTFFQIFSNSTSVGNEIPSIKDFHDSELFLSVSKNISAILSNEKELILKTNFIHFFKSQNESQQQTSSPSNDQDIFTIYPSTFSEDEVQKINSFLSHLSLVPNTFSSTDFNSSSNFLVNSIIFQATWKLPYQRSKTFPMKFSSFSKQYQVDFMHRKSQFNYCETELFKALQLPYSQGYSMYIFLPNDSTPESLSSIIRSDFSSLTFSTFTVMTQIPKFIITSKLDLSNSIQTPFPFIQSMTFSCQEDGTQEGESTSLHECCSYEPNMKHFNANHPFLFSVSNGQHTLFSGALIEPPEAKPEEDTFLDFL